MNIYKTQAQIENNEPCPCGAENWRTSKLYCSDCRSRVQPSVLDEMARNTRLRAIMSVIALSRPDRREAAQHDYNVLLEEYQALQQGVAA